MFTNIVSALDTVIPPKNLRVEPATPPRHVSPYSHALTATTGDRERPDITGRCVLLHDPAGVERWGGSTRFVSHIVLHTELCQNAEQWLRAHLESSNAEFHHLAGALTHTTSTRFGDGWVDNPHASTEQTQIHASWTLPLEDAATHLQAWYAMLSRP